MGGRGRCMSAIAAATEHGADRARWWPAPASTRRRCSRRWRRRSTRSARGASCSGSGSGWNRREFDAFGIPYDKRVSRFEEAFAIIRGLLDGERVTLDGTYHRADDVVLLPDAGAPDADHDRLQRAPDARHHAPPRAGVEHLVGRLPQRRRRAWPKLIDEIGIPDTVTRSACMLVQLDGMPVERTPDGMDAVEQATVRRAHRGTGRGRRRRGDRRRQPHHRALDPNARGTAAAARRRARRPSLRRGRGGRRASARRPASAPDARGRS